MQGSLAPPSPPRIPIWRSESRSYYLPRSGPFSHLTDGPAGAHNGIGVTPTTSPPSFGCHFIEEGMTHKGYAPTVRVEPLESRVCLTAGGLDPSFGVGGRVTTDFLADAPSG